MVERAARALASEFGFDRDSGEFYSPAYWDHIAEVALKAAGVVSREEHEREINQLREAARLAAGAVNALLDVLPRYPVGSWVRPTHAGMDDRWDAATDAIDALSDLRTALSSSGEVG